MRENNDLLSAKNDIKINKYQNKKMILIFKRNIKNETIEKPF